LNSSHLWCPDCSERLAVPGPSCPGCGDDYETVHGIPSFTTDESSTAVREVAAVAESDSEQNLFRHLQDRPDGGDFLRGVFDGLRDDWRMLVPDRIDGRCLDVGAGFGTRSLMLAEFTDAVEAVDPSLHKLRVLSETDHHLGQHVRPIHATLSTLPFQDSSFDTVVAGAESDSNLESVIRRLRSLLNDQGTLCLKLLGASEVSGLVGDGGVPEGMVGSLASLPRTLRNCRLSRYQGLLSQFFDSVEFYALFPTVGKGQFVFPLGDTAAAWHLLADKVERRLPRIQRAAKLAIPALVATGLVPHGYVAVCSDGDVAGSDPMGGTRPGDHDRLLIRGQRRTVVIHLDEDGISFVRKLPKNTRTSLYDSRGTSNRREQSMLDWLRKADEPVISTLPNGNLEETPLGPVRTEEPVEGAVVGRRIRENPAQFRQNLQAGFSWVAEFQQTFGGEKRTASPDTIQQSLSVPALDLEAPSISKPVATFETPTKGDHSPENLFVDPDNGDVVAAIDWERSTEAGSPFRDPCRYALALAARTFGGFEQGLQRAFVADTPYSEALADEVAKHAEVLGLEPYGFVVHLVTPDVRELTAEYLDSSKPMVWDPVICDRIEYVWEHQDAIVSTLC
jgi:SAM-dependent methyltransferase